MEQPNIEQPGFRTILARAMVAPLIIMALLAGVLLWQIDSYRAATRAVIRSDRTIAQANQLQRLLVDMETGLRGYLIAGADEFLDPYNQALPQIQPALDTLNTRVADQPDQIGRLKQTLQEYDQWRQYANGVLELRKSGGDYASVVAAGIGKQTMDNIRTQMGAFIQSETDNRDTLADNAQQTAQVVIYTSLGLALIVGALLAFYSRRQLIVLSHSYNQAFALARERAGQVAEQRERLQVTLTSIGDGVIVTDTAGNVIFVNPAAQALTGWDQADAEGRPLEQVFVIVNEDTRQTVDNPVAKVLREGTVVGLANHSILIARHGTEAPIDDSAAPIRDGNGTIVGVVLVFRDIADRKQAEQAIQQSEERFRLVFENAPIGICLGRDGQILYGNQALANMFGYADLDELRGLPLTELVAPDMRAALDDQARRRVQGELVPQSYETIGLRKNGVLFPYTVDVDRVMLSDGPAAVAFCIDISERQRANAALRASEQRYRDLADAMPQVVWIAQSNGELEYYNQRWFDYTGLTLEQTKGWGWQPVLHPDDLQNCLDRWFEAVRTGRPFEIEYRWQRADGVYRWHLGRALAVRDADGQIAYWVGTGTDIEEQKQAEDQQRLLAEASVLLVSSLDYEPMLTQLTRLIVPRLADWCAIHTLEDDVIRRLAFTHSDPTKQALVSDRPERYSLDAKAQHIVSQVLRSGEPELYSDVPDTLLVEAARDDDHLQTLRTLDFRSYMCLPMVARGHTLGTITLATAESGRRYNKADLAFGEDLASRTAIALDNARLYRDAEAARRRLAFLAQASELLSSSLEYESRLKSLADLAVPYLADWCIIDMVQEDESIERLKIAIADRSKEPLAQQLQLRHPVLKPDDHHTVLNVLRTGRSWIDPKVSDARLAGEGRDPEHVELLRKLGFKSEMVVPLVARERVLGTITFVYGASGNSYGPAELALAEDLARRAAAAVDNARLYRDAQAAVRARDQFLSIASHELKTPLTSLIGYVDLMQRRAARTGDQGERDQRAMRVVGEQAARLNKLVGALLDLSRIETGQLSIERGLVDVNALARRLVEEGQPTTDRHTITFSGSNQPIMLLGDELRIEQVIQNLIQNAIKYSPSGGRVTVQVERQAANACIRVSDQGIGIPAAALPQLFRRFYRAPNADSQHISGMGIGLYVVKEIVELHGGTVEVASQESQGSTFTISLPLLKIDK